MVVLAGLCVLIALAAPLWPLLLRPAVAAIIPAATSADLKDGIATAASQGSGPLMGVMLGSYMLLGLIVLMVCVRRMMLSGQRVEQAGTWDCGYLAPTPRMQYTASSFSRPVILLFRLFLQPRDKLDAPRGLFPARAGLHTRTPDMFRKRIYEPIFAGIAWIASKVRWLQQGRIQVYVLYIALTLLVLLIWNSVNP
jgi:hypothetical protein